MLRISRNAQFLKKRILMYFERSASAVGATISDPHIEAHQMTKTTFSDHNDSHNDDLLKLYEQYKVVEDMSLAGGGPNATKRHMLINKKLTPRNRLKLLFDNGKYEEIMWASGYKMEYGDVPSGGTIAAIGKVYDKLCIGMCSEATFKGGSIFPIGVKKQLRLQELALLLGLPCIYLVDSAGGFLPLQSDFFADYDGGGKVFANLALLGAAGVHQLAVVGGSSTAGGAYLPTMTAELAMIRGIGQIFLGGPPLVHAATGEIITADELGGADLHSSVSGVSDHLGTTEHEATEAIRSSVGTLPDQNLRASVAAHLNLPYAEPLFQASQLQDVAKYILAQTGNMEKSRTILLSLLGCLLDSSSFHEFMPRFGGALVTGFGRIGGHMVGCLSCCGHTIQADDADKASRFLQLCQQRGLSLVSLVHTSASNDINTIEGAHSTRAKAKLMSLMNTVDVSRLTVLIGNAMHEDYYLLGAPSTSPVYTLAWPTAKFVDGDAFQAAGKLWVDDVILPEDTRSKIIFWLNTMGVETFANTSNRLPVLRI